MLGVAWSWQIGAASRPLIAVAITKGDAKFYGSGLDRDLARMIRDGLRDEIGKGGKYVLAGQEETDKAIKKAGEKTDNCPEECLGKIGKALRARKVIACNGYKWGNKYVTELWCYDPEAEVIDEKMKRTGIIERMEAVDAARAMMREMLDSLYFILDSAEMVKQGNKRYSEGRLLQARAWYERANEENPQPELTDFLHRLTGEIEEAYCLEGLPRSVGKLELGMKERVFKDLGLDSKETTPKPRTERDGARMVIYSNLTMEYEVAIPDDESVDKIHIGFYGEKAYHITVQYRHDYVKKNSRLVWQAIEGRFKRAHKLTRERKLTRATWTDGVTDVVAFQRTDASGRKKMQLQLTDIKTWKKIMRRMH